MSPVTKSHGWTVRTRDGCIYLASEFDRDGGTVRIVGQRRYSSGRLGPLAEVVIPTRELKRARREVTS